MVSLPALAAPDVAATFAGTTESCFLLYDVKADKLVRKHETNAHCTKAYAPSTSFLFALSLLGFDSGVLAPDRAFAWDKTEHKNNSWNQPQTPASWAANSVGWVSAEIANQIGAPKMQAYLQKLQYGNADLSSGVPGFWQAGGSLTITPEQQLTFMRAFSKGTLPLSKVAISETRSNFLYAHSNGWTLSGKPGAGAVSNDEGAAKYGWFLGEVSKKGQRFVVVTHIVAPNAYYQGKCPGCTARRLSMSLLREFAVF